MHLSSSWNGIRSSACRQKRVPMYGVARQLININNNKSVLTSVMNNDSDDDSDANNMPILPRADLAHRPRRCRRRSCSVCRTFRQTNNTISTHYGCAGKDYGNMQRQLKYEGDRGSRKVVEGGATPTETTHPLTYPLIYPPTHLPIYASLKPIYPSTHP